jgi:hypothetical protein
MNLALLLLAACTTEHAPVSAASFARVPRLTLTLDTEPMYTGYPWSLSVRVADNAAPGELVVYASPVEAPGPCAPSGVCLDVAAPLLPVGRLPVGEDVYPMTWRVPSQVPEGASVFFQAALLQGGDVVTTSMVVEAVAVTPQPGCMTPTSPDYDPSANVDDGSCACPGQLTVTSAAALRPYLTCAVLGELEVSGLTSTLLELPSLAVVDRLVLADNPGVEGISLPALREAGSVEIVANPRLRAISVPGADELDGLQVVGNPRLTTLQLATTGTLHGLQVTDNARLRTLDLTRTRARSVTVARDPQLVSIRTGALAADNSLLLERLDALVTVDLGPTTRLDRLTLLSAPQITGLPAFAAGEIGRVELADLPALVQLTAGAVTRIDELALHDLTALTSIELQTAGTLTGAVRLERLPALREARLPPIATSGEVVIEALGALELLDLGGLTAVGALRLSALTALRTLDVGHLSTADELSLNDLDVAELHLDALTAAAWGEVDGFPHLTSLRAPSLTSVGDLHLGDLTALTSLTLPALVTADTLEVTHNPSLVDLHAPALRTFTSMLVSDNRSLEVLDLPSLIAAPWLLRVIDNPALCVTDFANLARPPRPAEVRGRGNACDP